MAKADRSARVVRLRQLLRTDVSRHRRHALRTQPQRRIAPGQCAHGAVQFSAGAQARGAFRAAHRGYRCPCAPRRRTSPRCAAIWRWLGLELGRRAGSAGSARALPPVAAHGDLPAAISSGSSARSWPIRASAASLELDLARRAQLAAGRPPRYAGTCRELSADERAARLAQGRRPSLRFRVPSGPRVEFDDLVHGPQRFLSDDIGDFIIRREDGSRGILLQQRGRRCADERQPRAARRGPPRATRRDSGCCSRRSELPPPQYGHVSLLVGEDGTPLSKRHGATSVRELRDAGYSSAAVCNHLFRLGHSTPLNQMLSLAADGGGLRPRASAARAGAFRTGAAAALAE